MIYFWAAMLDETGCEFGAGVSAESRSEAIEKLREDYPESQCVQLESPEDTARREREMYHRLQDEYDDFYDDYDEDEEEDEEDDFTDEDRNERHQRWAEDEDEEDY